MFSDQKLQDIKNHFFNRAENLWWGILATNIAIEALAVLLVYFSNTYFVLGVGLLGILSPVVTSWLRELEQDWRGKGDKCRRYLLIMDGLGEKLKAEEYLEVDSWVLHKNIKRATYEAPYFFSTKQRGPSRLMQNIGESAFFTSNNAKAMYQVYFIVFIVAAFIVASVLYVGVASYYNLGRVVAVILTGLLSERVFLAYRKYRNLHEVSQDVFKKCCELARLPDLELARSMLIMEEYDLALAVSPPIPRIIYKLNANDLNRAYRESPIWEEKNG